MVPLTVVAVLVLVFAGMLVFMIGRRGAGPGPADTAVAYEHAWDRLDFATLWNLSSDKLRDGRSRADFVAGKKAAYQSEGLSRLVRSVRPEIVDVSGPLARVVTRLELADGQSIRDEMLLERVGSAWRVTAYHLASPRKGET
ncbi:MAG: hypothetical protein ACRDYV_04415 [Acidimicrobiia bacterium]